MNNLITIIGRSQGLRLSPYYQKPVKNIFSERGCFCYAHDIKTLFFDAEYAELPLTESYH